MVLTNLAPAVLGYSQNLFLEPYFERYFNDGRLFLMGKVDESMCIPEFLLIPDISTTIEHMKKEGIDSGKGLSFITEEWLKFSDKKKNEMFSLKGQPIRGVNIRLSLTDANPDNHIDIHPDHPKEHVGMGWGNVHPDKWENLYAQAFSILKEVSPGHFDEIERMVCKIIPMGVSISKHNSASYSSCIGHLYMSYPVEMQYPELALLEAIIHESNHNKLNLILKSDPLIRNTREEIYYSPYRPDARHIHGIYLGLHAMVAVFYIFFSAYRDKVIILDDRWLEKSFAHVMKNGLAIRVLQKYGSFTPMGETILDEMMVVHSDTLETIRNLGIGGEIKKRSETIVREHFSSVARSYAYLRY